MSVADFNGGDDSQQSYPLLYSYMKLSFLRHNYSIINYNIFFNIIEILLGNVFISDISRNLLSP